MTSVGKPEGEDWRRQHEVPRQIGGVENQQDGFGPGGILAFPGQNIVGDLLVFGTRIEAIDAGQVDDVDGAAAGELREAGMLFHCDAGEVGDFLAHPGQAIKESGFAAVGRPDEGYGFRGNREEAVVPRPGNRDKRSHLPLSGRSNGQVGGSFAAEGNFGTVDLEDSGIAARSTLSGRDEGSREEAKFHEAAGVVNRKVDRFQDRGIASTQVQKRMSNVVATELQVLDGLQDRLGGLDTAVRSGLGQQNLHVLIITGY